MLLRARTVLPMISSALEDGAVRVDGAKILEVGTREELPARVGEEVVELGDVVLLPGLINAHCHLEYSTLRGAIAPPGSFTKWVQQINSIKRQLSPEDILTAISRGYREAQRFGTTTICSMVAFPDLLAQLPPAKLRTWWFYEMIDVRHRVTSEEVVAGALSFFEQREDPLVQFGLNPHAPYTASLLLYRLAHACAGKHAMLLTSHVAESLEETAMFATGAGALHDFLAGLGRPMYDCGFDTPFGWLWRNAAIGPDWILAHLNDLRPSDFSLLETIERERFPHVVHCPGSHAYFRHPPFAWTKLSGLGVNISVGTDSLASTDSLSLLSELRRLHAVEPGLSAEDLLATVTLAPARALRQEGRLGCIAPGALADLIAIPWEDALEKSASKAAAACVEFRRWIPWIMVDGKILSP
jgi:cytosine/adenosine deaminase-related metal-dependent hydrolase